MQAAMNGTVDEVHDWRCVSQHHTLTLIERAVDGQRLIDRFAPDLLVAAQDHALVVASQLADVLGARKSPRPTVLTHTMQLFDIAAHPYNPHAEAWTGGTLSGRHILAVDVVDSTRSTLSAFIAELQARVEAERNAAQAADTPWADPHVGVFVLHNKRRPKAADLPAEVMDGRYFAGEEVDNVAISYPFRAAAANVHQPSAHGDHEHRWAATPRRSLEERPVVHRSSTPPVHEDQRILSTHYVEEIIEKAVVQQQLLSSFQPHLLIAATDDSVAPARILRHHLLSHGHTSRVLTSTLDLYDEHVNPYNPVMPAGEFAKWVRVAAREAAVVKGGCRAAVGACECVSVNASK